MSSTSSILQAPLRGVVVPLAEVPDLVFAEGTMGPGIAIDPLSETLHAPCNGEVIQCARAAHAITLRDANGAEWLLHIGLDTVDLNGEGFELLVAEGERVSAGDPLCRFEADRLAQRATALITPLILTNAEGRTLETLVEPGMTVERGEDLLRWQAPESAQAAAVADDPAGHEAGHRASGEVVVGSSSGLHARPAARLRAIARDHQVELALTAPDGREAKATSLSALLNLGLLQGDRVSVAAQGARARAAVDAAVELLGHAEAGPGEGNTSRAPAGESTPGRLTGLMASPGIAVGPLRHYDPPLPVVAETATDPQAECRALDAALEAVSASLSRAHETARRQGQGAEAEIFEAHQAWLQDPDLRAAAEARIDAGRGAGQAWFEALEAEAERLRASGNALLAARADDLRDLQRQVMQHFAADQPEVSDAIEGAILVAREIAPSQFVAVADRIQGLCLAAGGTTSHVAILARARGVPCLVAMGEALLEAEGERACLDATRGVLELAPDDTRLAAVERQRESLDRQAAAERAAAAEPAITQDGRHVQVAANVGSAWEAGEAAAAGADGIGLMRSEFLFLERHTAPDLIEQQTEYQAVVEALDGKPVIVRLLDIGADKQLPYLALPATPNPALGERGVRLWQSRPELFETQLDALLEAGRQAPVSEDGLPALRLMVPMISEVGELRWVRERLNARAAALGISPVPPLGAMIEVPSAALCAASLAREADFLSIGTNDLTQYALAMDREIASLAARSDVLHPGVLRLVAACLEGAAGRCPVAVCGAAAGDPLAGALLVAMGVDELSVEPGRVAAVKAALRELDAGGLQARLPELLALDDASEVRRALSRLLNAGAATAGDSAQVADDITTKS
ncbi:phosphoenolpyruvate--protein phosphotransferase [Salinicola peritrichatus]|uniref:phosphoenolpyruvate--protein phosphotransferase n=1 Tax=Salinicola peritrichatus TaxID=1267424 RepID=UPI000DA1E35E|nr:phosphoenolpyruvate--protein phosphotransferase [Salinicola peritrichatus]